MMTACGLAACEGFEGTAEYNGPESYIAVANDQGRDATNNRNDNAGIAVTPDGCQTWYIDDGLEARASKRLDPVSGLPVCAGEPGVVYGPYKSNTQGFEDSVLRRLVKIRTTKGHGHTVRH